MATLMDSSSLCTTQSAPSNLAMASTTRNSSLDAMTPTDPTRVMTRPSGLEELPLFSMHLDTRKISSSCVIIRFATAKFPSLQTSSAMLYLWPSSLFDWQRNCHHSHRRNLCWRRGESIPDLSSQTLRESDTTNDMNVWLQVTKNNQTYAFDYISNVERKVDESGRIFYEVNVKRLPCSGDARISPIPGSLRKR